MRKKLTPGILIITIVAVVVACSKNKDKYINQDLLGTWKFVGLDVSLQNKGNYKTGNVPVLWINTSSYNTIKTKGTVTTSPGSMSVNGLGFYAPNTFNFSIVYKNNKVTDSITFRSDITSSTMNRSTDFQFIGTDSIYTTGTGLANLDNFVNQQATTGGGLKYTFKGDTLLFTSIFHHNYINTSVGGSANVVDDATTKMFFVKQ